MGGPDWLASEGFDINATTDFTFANDFDGRGGPFPGGPPPAGASPAPAPGDEPTLVTAMQEQLGLELDPRRAAVDVLVIDSVEKPSEN